MDNYNIIDEHLPKAFAICLDTSGGKILTGFNTKTKKLYQQEYVD